MYSAIQVNNSEQLFNKLISQRIKSKYDEMKNINRSKTSTLAKSKFEKILGELFDVIVCPCRISPCAELRGQVPDDWVGPEGDG